MKTKNDYAELAALFMDESKRAVADANRIPLFDYGTMQADGSLRVHRWRKNTWKPGEFGFMVHDTYLEPLTETYPVVVTGGPHSHPDAGTTASHSHDPHFHYVVRPPEMDPLSIWPAGTIVGVLWLYGTRPVITGRIAG